MTRVLFLCHAHPDLQTGGTEIFARDLFRGLRAGGDIEGVFVAATAAGQRPPSPGTPFQAAGPEPDELLLWSGGFDTFELSQTDLHGVVPNFAALLRELQPDIVHIHHLLGLGIEMVGLVRRVTPTARIVFTLHDYYLLCAHDGQMVTTAGMLCHAASPDACRACLPDRSFTAWRLRAIGIWRALDQVDRFIAPSQFIRGRFIAAGLAPERIEVVANGLPSAAAAPARAITGATPGVGERRDRFGFFGHINRFKGATVAVEASARLSAAGVAHGLALHGGTAHQSAAVLDRFAAALRTAPDSRHAGPYGRADLPRLMGAVDWVVVPSIWWENAPLVIQEAFQHRRPVICSNIGGMAEMVRDGTDGLHAAPGDPASLAETMRRAIETPGSWDGLRRSMAPPVPLAESVAAHRAVYAGLRSRPGRVSVRRAA